MQLHLGWDPPRKRKLDLAVDKNSFPERKTEHVLSCSRMSAALQEFGREHQAKWANKQTVKKQQGGLTERNLTVFGEKSGDPSVRDGWKNSFVHSILVACPDWMNEMFALDFCDVGTVTNDDFQTFPFK